MIIRIIKSVVALILSVLYYDNIGPLWIRPVLALYSFLLFLMVKIRGSASIDRAELSNNTFLIILVCVVLIEILNQTSFLIRRFNFETAAILKGIFFWIILTGGAITYFYMARDIQGRDVWVWHENIGFIVINLSLSWILPSYSFCPEYRFLFLRGNIKSRKNIAR
jgi:hypothetical protein